MMLQCEPLVETLVQVVGDSAISGMRGVERGDWGEEEQSCQAVRGRGAEAELTAE